MNLRGHMRIAHWIDMPAYRCPCGFSPSTARELYEHLADNDQDHVSMLMMISEANRP